jgi:hypothetical protein
MDFDHVTGIKIRNVSAMLSSESAMMTEIAKCELVCGNCHRIRTYAKLPKKEADPVRIIQRRRVSNAISA